MSLEDGTVGVENMKRIGLGGAGRGGNPNRYNVYSPPGTPGDLEKARRRPAALMESVETLKCPRCSFATRRKEHFDSHDLRCQTERERFEASGAASKDDINKAVVAAVAAAVKPMADALALQGQAIAALLAERTGKEPENDARSKPHRKGPVEEGPAPQPAVG